jgi:hypothetical protein
MMEACPSRGLLGIYASLYQAILFITLMKPVLII